MEKIKVILVDDHQLIREGIRSLLDSLQNIEVIGEASEAYELFELLKTIRPKVILMDINMPKMSGIEITSILKQEYPAINICILSMHNKEDFIFNAIKAGAKGYIPKDTSRKEIIDAITALANDEEYYNEAVSKILLKSYISQAKGNEPIEAIQPLSKRELEILKLVAEGVSNQDIADQLFISIRTVETHKTNIMQKLNVNSSVDLVKYAIKNNIIEL